MLCLIVGLSGWGPASVRAQSPTNVTMTVTNDATIEWVWATQFMFTATSAGHGTVGGDGNGWYDEGATVRVTATPAAYRHFVAWTGTVNSVSNPLPLTVNQSHDLAAQFADNLATNDVPEWWLADHGFTNGDWNAAALDDQDHDGMPTWKEWIAGCDPTNADSVLRVLSVAQDGGGSRILWKGGTGVWQYVERREDLGRTGDVWTVIYSNMPPMAVTNDRLDSDGVGGALFYRIRTEHP